MSKYRHQLPQLQNKLFLTDGGLETTLVFQRGIDLPDFAAFDLLRRDRGYDTLYDYYCTYAGMARAADAGFILESATWRANPDWAKRLGYALPELERVNAEAIDMLVSVREAFETEASPMVISGNIGPRGDGYRADRRMSADEAQDYHTWQARWFARSHADMIAAFTLNYPEEAIGVVRAAVAQAMPVAISFTVETDGRLPTGQPLGDAIDQVDAETGNAAAYYMINCAHPSHFREELTDGARWMSRIRGLRGNASSKSHAELDAATELDAGNPEEFGQMYRQLRQRFAQLTVLGGCCGTDHRHLASICQHCVA